MTKITVPVGKNNSEQEIEGNHKVIQIDGVEHQIDATGAILDKDGKIFKNKVPFSIFETDLILYIPENKKDLIHGNYYYFINVIKYTTYQHYFNVYNIRSEMTLTLIL